MEELMTKTEVFHFLMRKLSNISIKLQKKHFEKIQYVISQLDNLEYFPNDIRRKCDYIEDSILDD